MRRPRDLPLRLAALGVRGSIPRVSIRGLLLVVAIFLTGCAAQDAREHPHVREVNALLRDIAIDVRIPVTECTNLPPETRAALRDSPRRIAAARARLARLRLPDDYAAARLRLDEGLRLIAEANALLLAWTQLPDDAKTGECGQSSDNLRNNAYDEVHDLAKPHLQAFMDAHNPLAAQIGQTGWELGAAGLIPRSR